MKTEKIVVGTLTEEFLITHYDEFLYLEKEWKTLGDRPWTQEKFFQGRQNKWELSSYASLDGNLVGYTIVSADKEDYLHKILVDSNHQNKGIGGLLLNETKRKCAEKGIKNLGFKVRTNGEPAIKFYKKFNTTFLEKDVAWDGIERYQCELILG